MSNDKYEPLVKVSKLRLVLYVECYQIIQITNNKIVLRNVISVVNDAS